MEIKQLQVLVMPNGEIICKGKTIGMVSQIGEFLNLTQKIEIPFTDNDVEELREAGKEYEWSFPTKCGQEIDVHIYKEELE